MIILWFFLFTLFSRCNYSFYLPGTIKCPRTSVTILMEANTWVMRNARMFHNTNMTWFIYWGREILSSPNVKIYDFWPVIPALDMQCTDLTDIVGGPAVALHVYVVEMVPLFWSYCQHILRPKKRCIDWFVPFHNVGKFPIIASKWDIVKYLLWQMSLTLWHPYSHLDSA